MLIDMLLEIMDIIPHHDDQPDDNALLLRSDVIRNNSPGGLCLLFIFDHVVVDGTTYESFLQLDFFLISFICFIAIAFFGSTMI